MRRADQAPMRQAVREIQTFIKAQADQGATWAHLHVHDQFVDYQDDQGTQRRFPTDVFDRDLIHGFDADLACHIAPDGMHIHISNHARGRRAVDEPAHRHIRNASHRQVVQPRATDNGRFIVHLAESRQLRHLTAINPDGTANYDASRDIHPSIQYT